MIISNKENKEEFKSEISQALINATGCLAFVAKQEMDAATHLEFKNLDKICEKLDNLWDYADFCINNEINIDISDYSYNLVRRLTELYVEDYKVNYRMYGGSCIDYV